MILFSPISRNTSLVTLNNETTESGQPQHIWKMASERWGLVVFDDFDFQAFRIKFRSVFELAELLTT